MKIIIGLGNPGREYERTRHNAGWRVIDFLISENRIIKKGRESLYQSWIVNLGSQDVWLVKPLTFMNESGKAVEMVLENSKESPENLIFVHDDLDLPLGNLKITASRGPGTHKGFLSIVSQLGRNDLVRVRMGIGQQKLPVSRTDFVLSDFTPEEEKVITPLVEKAAFACKDIIILGLEKAMTRWNSLSRISQEKDKEEKCSTRTRL